MPAVQTTYPGTLAVGLQGAVVDTELHNVISRLSGSATTMAFGIVALRGSTDETVLQPGDTSPGPYLGITIISPTVRPVVNSLPDVYQPGDNVAILTKGVVWVTANVAVTPGQAAYYDSTGKFTNVASGNTAIPNAVFDSTAGAGALVKLRLS